MLAEEMDGDNKRLKEQLRVSPLARENSGAKARLIIRGLAYGLKPVPFKTEL
jgi:hypothetical protein